MVRGFVQMALGQWGTALLDAYYAYSLPINTLILAYGLIVLVSWTNLLRIKTWLIHSIAAQIADREDLDANAGIPKLMKKIDIPWQKALERRFPMVARQASFLPRKATPEALRALLDAEELVREARSRVRQGGEP